MSILTKEQIEKGYFKQGGYLPFTRVTELSEYNGESELSIVCTQLDLKYSEREKKRILNEWIDFLRSDTKALSRVHFYSHVPQALFDAVCCQENLEELRLKWGAYSDLSTLGGLTNLKYLYIGSGARVQDISVLGQMNELVVLYIENFKRIEDFSLLTALNRLEQLTISGPIDRRIPIQDLEFLRGMKNLLSVWTPNISFRKKYTMDELKALHEDLPNLHAMYNSLWDYVKR